MTSATRGLRTPLSAVELIPFRKAGIGDTFLGVTLDVAWNTALRDMRSDRTKVPAGVISARALAQGFARFRHRPLVVAGRFDRSAIMAAAISAARAHQERVGGTWADAMSVALQGAWQAAKMARSGARH